MRMASVSKIQAEVAGGIAETDVPDHGSDQVFFVRKKSGLNLISDQIAEHAPEILVTWV